MATQRPKGTDEPTGSGQNASAPGGKAPAPSSPRRSRSSTTTEPGPQQAQSGGAGRGTKSLGPAPAAPASTGGPGPSPRAGSKPLPGDGDPNGVQPAGEGASAAGRSVGSATKAADGAQALDKVDKASKGLDGAGANLAGSATQKAIEGDGGSKGRRTAGRYAGSAVSGAIGGAEKGAAAGGIGAVPGAAIGAAKGVAVEGGKDAIKGGKKTLGAGGTGYVREQEDQETPGSKAAKGVAVAGGVAAAPPVGAVIALMTLLKWLKMLMMQLAAATLGFLQSLLAWVLAIPQMIGAAVGGVFGAIGSAIAGVVTTVVGVTIAPAAATASAGVATVAAITLAAGTLASAVIDSQAAANGDANSSHSCIVNTGSGPISVGDIDPDQEAHAQAVYKVLSGMGMPDENIAGILGNWEIESELDPTGVEGIYDEPYELGPKKKAKLDGGGTNYGIGLGQWTADRNTKLQEYAEAAGGEWYDMEIQLSFMTDPDGDNPADVAIIKGMVSEKKGSPSEAAEYFLTQWERAGVPALDARQEAAEKWFEAMDGWEEGSGSDSADVEPVSDGLEQLDLGQVKPHVQKAADLIYSRFKDGPGSGIEGAGGYRSGGGSYDDDAHGHHVGLAVDFMVALDGEGKRTGDALAQYVIDNHKELGDVRYVIWQQRIWNLSAGDTGWQPMEDRGSPTQNHMDHPHVSWNSSGSVTDVAPVSTVSCSGGDSDGGGGGGGSVGLKDGGIDLKAAEKLMELYNEEADEVLGEAFADGGGPAKCNGSYVQNCTSFSWYFVHKYAQWDKGYASNNGKDTARVMAQLLATNASGTPTPYSVFSHGNSSAAGHTGIVLGVDGDRILIGEAAYCAFPGRARWVEASEWKNAGWSFTDLSDRIEGGELKV